MSKQLHLPPEEVSMATREGILHCLRDHRYDCNYSTLNVWDEECEHWYAIQHESGYAWALISRHWQTFEAQNLVVFVVVRDVRGYGIGTEFLQEIAAAYGPLKGIAGSKRALDFYRRAGCEIYIHTFNLYPLAIASDRWIPTREAAL